MKNQFHERLKTLWEKRNCLTQAIFPFFKELRIKFLVCQNATLCGNGLIRKSIKVSFLQYEPVKSVTQQLFSGTIQFCKICSVS